MVRAVESYDGQGSPIREKGDEAAGMTDRNGGKERHTRRLSPRRCSSAWHGPGLPLRRGVLPGRDGTMGGLSALYCVSGIRDESNWPQIT